MSDLAFEQYGGFNPKFVKSVWRKRRLAAIAAAKDTAKARKKITDELREAKKLESARIATARLSIDENIGLAAPDAATGKQIIKVVCARYGVLVKDVLGKRGKSDIVKVRWAAMAEIRLRTGYNYHAIGRLFGRDHSSVLHAMRKMGVEGRVVA